MRVGEWDVRTGERAGWNCVCGRLSYTNDAPKSYHGSIYKSDVYVNDVVETKESFVTTRPITHTDGLPLRAL